MIFYKETLVEPSSILEWFNKNANRDTTFRSDAFETMMNSCKPFIKWLEDQESESESSDEDTEEDSSSEEDSILDIVQRGESEKKVRFEYLLLFFQSKT